MDTERSCASGAPARFLYDNGGGIQVWEIDAPPEQRAVLLVGSGPPVVLLSHRITGTADEQPSLTWAAGHVARGSPEGIYVRLC